MRSGDSPLKSEIFLTGTQRSGTTLLHHVLDASSQIWSRNEMYEVHPLVFGNGSCRRDKNRQLISLLERFLRLDLSDLYAESTQVDGATILKGAMRIEGERRGKKRWCLKDPRLSYFLDEYTDAFPDAHFIVIVRDPRAVCRSYLSKAGFTVGRPANWVTAAERWEREVKTQLQFIDRHRERATLVIYEQLLQDFEVQVRYICDRVQVEVEPQMLRYFERGTEINIHDGNENIFRPPDLGLANKWRAELTEKQIRTVESITAGTMEKLGFEPSFGVRDLSLANKWLCRLHDRVVRECRWQQHKLQKRRSPKPLA
jgi:hypothetical protein